MRKFITLHILIALLSYSNRKFLSTASGFYKNQKNLDFGLVAWTRPMDLVAKYAVTRVITKMGVHDKEYLVEESDDDDYSDTVEVEMEEFDYEEPEIVEVPKRRTRPVVEEKVKEKTRDKLKNKAKEQIKTRIVKRLTRRSVIPYFPDGLLAILIVLLVAGYWFSYFTIVNFPQPEVGVEKFNAKNVYDNIYNFTVKIGPRVTGTPACEVATVNALMSIFEEIKRNKASDIDVEIEHLISDFSYYRNGTLYTMAMNFRGVQLFVVRVAPTNCDPNLKHILFNAHYDTVPNAPGAGDDFQQIATEIELMRVFSRRRVLKHPLLFMFTSAEENGLAGSYQFLIESKWAKKVGVLVNLESAGGGGKETLFQVHEEYAWLAEAYQKVRDPYATVIADELFGLGLIPSDTDYTNFQLYDPTLPGLSFALNRDGYTYHTRADDIFTVNMGSIQHQGNNMMDLTHALDSSSAMDDFLPTMSAIIPVYYDIFGLFTLVYSKATSVDLNYLVAIITIVISVVRACQIKRFQGLSSDKIVSEFVIAHIVQLLSIVLGLVAVYGIATLTDKLDRPLSYYHNTWLLFGIFFAPYVAINVFGPILYIMIREYKWLTSAITELHVIAQGNLMAVLCVVLNYLGLLSTYIFQILLGFYILSLAIIILLRGRSKNWIAVYTIGQLFPSIYIFYLLN